MSQGEEWRIGGLSPRDSDSGGCQVYIYFLALAPHPALAPTSVLEAPPWWTQLRGPHVLGTEPRFFMWESNILPIVLCAQAWPLPVLVGAPGLHAETQS